MFAPIEERLTPGMVVIALLFLTPHFEDDVSALLEKLSALFPTAVVLGCTAEGTIGAHREIERVPSMSLLAASVPGVEIRPFHLRQSHVEAAESADDWERLVGASPTRSASPCWRWWSVLIGIIRARRSSAGSPAGRTLRGRIG